jgi:hypothetical protein
VRLASRYAAQARGGAHGNRGRLFVEGLATERSRAVLHGPAIHRHSDSQ